MTGYTIGEAAQRSGFSPSTLRYYEDMGLVSPAGRTASGYRLYDDEALGRLDFIGRSKELGCSLEEIRDLLTIWEDRCCAPVQLRFHQLVTAKIAEARRQIDELSALASQLQVAAAHLAGPATDGPCGEDCACATAPSAAEVVPTGLTEKPIRNRRDRPPLVRSAATDSQNQAARGSTDSDPTDESSRSQ